MKYGRAFWQHHRSEQLRCASLLVSGLAADMRCIKQCCCSIPCPCCQQGFTVHMYVRACRTVHAEHACRRTWRSEQWNLVVGCVTGQELLSQGTALLTRGSSSLACSAASPPEQHQDLLPAGGQGSPDAAAAP